MKKFLLAYRSCLVALVGMAVPASAADMAVKALPPPIIAPIFNWTGSYIGANGGWAKARFAGTSSLGGWSSCSDGCRDWSGWGLSGAA